MSTVRALDGVSPAPRWSQPSYRTTLAAPVMRLRSSGGRERRCEITRMIEKNLSSHRFQFVWHASTKTSAWKDVVFNVGLIA
jgi:hypothetical protein